MHTNTIHSITGVSPTHQDHFEDGCENFYYYDKNCSDCRIEIYLNSNGRCHTIEHTHKGKVINLKQDRAIYNEEDAEPPGG